MRRFDPVIPNMKNLEYVLETKVNGGEYKSFTVVKADQCEKLSETKFVFDSVEIEFDEPTVIKIAKEREKTPEEIRAIGRAEHGVFS